MSKVVMPTSPNALVSRIRSALNRLKPRDAIVRISVANELKWEKSPGQTDEVLVRWLCWSIDDGETEVLAPEFEVAGREVTEQLLASELPIALPGVTIVVDDDIEV